MGAIISRLAVLLRPVIQFAVTWIAVDVFARYIAPQLNDTIANIAIRFGVDQQTAQDIAANEYLLMAEQIGIGAATIKSRTPAIVADKLGFTTRGYAKRKLPPKTEAQVAQAKGDKTAFSKASSEVIQQESQKLSLLKRVSVERVSQVSQIIIAGFGVPITLGLLITNTIDFGAWNSSSYQGTFQRFLSFFGLEPDKETTAPRTVSKETFDKVFVSLQNEGVKTIRNPWTGETVAFNRDNAVKIIDKLASHIFIEKGSVSAKSLLGATIALVDLPRGNSSAAAGSAPAAAAASSPAPTVKVFTGVVSQGALGNATSFEPRPDDLITSIAELQTASANNLAPFIASLAGKVVYEIKIQASVTTKDGFTQRGTTQRIQVGTNANGTPKYKTVTNKFAVMNLYLLTERGARTKLTQIVLGPTDATSFQPSQADVVAIESFLRSSISTSDVSQISSVNSAPVSQNPVSGGGTDLSQNSTAQIALQRINVTPRDYYVYNDPFFDYVFYRDGDQIIMSPTFGEYPSHEVTQKEGNYGQQVAAGIKYLLQSGVDVTTFRKEQFPYEINGRQGKIVNTKSFAEFFGPRGAAPVQAPPQTTQSPACQANTLFEFYGAQGQALPSVAARSLLYAELNLGQASFYTGTAEQNAKLLAALKTRLGCMVV